MVKKASAPKKIYQIKVTLRGSKPSIWRRIQVADNITLGGLHEILQPLMGWYNCHLHQFRKGNSSYADCQEHDDLECFDEAIDENKVKLSTVLKNEKEKIVYEYDFGDGWEHDIVLEKITAPDKEVKYPICLAGKRRCPPEDCGGVWGYENSLHILKDPKHPEYAETREWMGENFDPEEFELDEVNAAFRYMQ